jgi:hypothetical protein
MKRKIRIARTNDCLSNAAYLASNIMREFMYPIKRKRENMG